MHSAALKLSADIVSLDIVNGEILIRRSRSGDATAIRALVEQHAQMAFRIAYRMTGHQEQAEDIAQDVITRMLDYREGWDSIEGFRAWLRRAVINRVIDNHRRSRIWRWGTFDEAANIPHDQAAADETLDARRIEKKVAEAVVQLPPRQRAAITLFFYERLSLNEIAASLGTTPAAVEGLLHRAKEALKHQLRALNRELANG